MTGPALALSGVQPGLDTFQLVMGLLGGLALFLFGMEQMATALKAVAGERLKTVLGRLTTNRFMGVLTGALITSVIQSSSVTTVLVVGFITAGLMSLVQSIGVILGADIGTTITAQIVAFKVTKYAMLMIAVGFSLNYISRRESLRNHGAGIMGLGVVFLGMSLMGDAMSPLRSHEPFVRWMAQMETPWLGILAGLAFTALVQSSSATIGVVIVMASQGLITLPAGIALSFGANIGTCVTALLAAIGKPREAVRAAVAHVLIKVLGVLMWILFIPQLAELVTWLSPRGAGLPAAERLASITPRQIANAHTLFNVANTLVFIGFVPVLARVVQRIVPDRPLEDELKVRARYLDEDLLDTPFLALDRARLELLHLGDLVKQLLEQSLAAILSGTREQIIALRAGDDAVDELHGQIVTYAGKISRTQLSDKETGDLVTLFGVANDLESIGDIIETNLAGLGLHRIEAGLSVSDVTRQMLVGFHQTVVKALDSSIVAATQRSVQAAQVVIDMKAEVNRLADAGARHEVKRLVAEEPHRLEAYALEKDILENLKRVYYFAKRIARAVAPGEDEATA